jgi:hypothetical protein
LPQYHDEEKRMTRNKKPKQTDIKMALKKRSVRVLNKRELDEVNGGTGCPTRVVRPTCGAVSGDHQN